MKVEAKRRIYSASVLGLWLVLVGYEAYDGYFRPRSTREEVAEMFEPWEAFYRIEWMDRPVGFLAERLFLGPDSTGWIRESQLYLSRSMGAGLVATGSMAMEARGSLRSFELSLRSRQGRFHVTGRRREGQVQILVERNGSPFLQPPLLPVPEQGRLRLDLPLLGLERLPGPALHRFALPRLPLLGSASFEVEVLPLDASGAVPGGRVLHVRGGDGEARLVLEPSGELRSLDGPGELGVYGGTRRTIGLFVEERDALLRELESQAAGEGDGSGTVGDETP